jgi:hypothetical protein
VVGRVLVAAGVGLITLLMWLAVAGLQQRVAPPPRATGPAYTSVLAWVGVDLFVDENTGAYVLTNRCPGTRMDGGRSAEVIWIAANNPANHVIFEDGETCRVIRVCNEAACVVDG